MNAEAVEYIRGIPVGYEEQISMYPLSFREFLKNTGIDEKVLDYVKECICNQETIEKTIVDECTTLALNVQKRNKQDVQYYKSDNTSERK